MKRGSVVFKNSFLRIFFFISIFFLGNLGAFETSDQVFSASENVSLNSYYPTFVEGNIGLNNGTLELFKNLYLGNGVSFVSPGNISAKGHALILNGELIVNEPVVFDNSVIINGQSNTIFFGQNGFFGGDNLLTIRNAVLRGLNNNKLPDGVSLDNIAIEFLGDPNLFSMSVNGIVSVMGRGKFTCRIPTIYNNAILSFDRGTTFIFDEIINNGVLHLNSCTIVGDPLTVKGGIVLIENNVTVVGQADFSETEVEFASESSRLVLDEDSKIQIIQDEGKKPYIRRNKEKETRKINSESLQIYTFDDLPDFDDNFFLTREITGSVWNLIKANSDAIISQDVRITTNANNIATNATDIDINAANIRANSRAIVNNSYRLNSFDLRTTTNATDIDINAANIRANSRAIVNNSYRLNSFDVRITTNATDIDINAANIRANSRRIINNSNAILNIKTKTNTTVTTINGAMFGFEVVSSSMSPDEEPLWYSVSAGAGSFAWATTTTDFKLYKFIRRSGNLFEWSNSEQRNADLSGKDVAGVSVSRTNENYVVVRTVGEVDPVNDRIYYSINGGTSWVNTDQIKTSGGDNSSPYSVVIGKDLTELYVAGRKYSPDYYAIYKYSPGNGSGGTNWVEIGWPSAGGLNPESIDIDINGILWVSSRVPGETSSFWIYDGTSWAQQWIQTSGWDLRFFSIYDNYLKMAIDWNNGRIWRWSGGLQDWFGVLVADGLGGAKAVSVGNPKNAWVIYSDDKLYTLASGTSLEDRVETLEESNTHTHNMYITESIRFGGVLLDDGTIERSGDVVITDPGLRVPPGYEDVVVELYG